MQVYIQYFYNYNQLLDDKVTLEIILHQFE